MTSQTINISWPSTLPLPFLEASGAPRHAIIASPVESASFQRRLRFSGTSSRLTVKWILRIGEYIDFKDFYLSELNLGTSLFTLELRFPKNSDLTTWVVRFTSNYRAEYLDGIWDVSASLDLISLYQLPDSALAEATGFFFLRPDDNPLIVKVDHPFIVKEHVDEDQSVGVSGFFVSPQQRRLYFRNRPFHTLTP